MNGRVQPDLQLWVFDQQALVSVPEQDWRDVLSDDEQQRVASYHFSADALRYAASRYWLRKVLAQHLGTSAQRVAFIYGEFGKPALQPDSALHFSMSHTDGLTLIATGDKPLGVDVEKLRTWNEAASRPPYFQPHELARIAACDERGRDALCWSLWTAKEALLKAIGDGIRAMGGVALREAANACDDYVLSPELERGTSWHLIRLEPAPGYVGALAVPAANVAGQPVVLSSKDLIAPAA